MDVWLFIWIYLGVIFAFGIGLILYLYRENIKRLYYGTLYPEKLIKVVIHYSSNQYKIFWRLIPIKNFFILQGMKYYFSDKSVIKDNDFYARENNTINVDGKTYNLQSKTGIKQSRKNFIELHYFYNNPSPIDFDYNKKKIDFNMTSNDLEILHKNDLFVKLLSLQQEKNLMQMLLMGIGINLCMSAFIIAKMLDII